MNLITKLSDYRKLIFDNQIILIFIIHFILNDSQSSQSFESSSHKQNCFWNSKMITFNEANKKSQESVKCLKTISNIPNFTGHKNQASTMNLYHIVQPIYYASRVFGSMPFSFKFNAKSEISGCRVKKRDFIWFLVSLFNYISMTFLCWLTLSVPNIEHSHILFVGNHVIITFGLICGVLDVIFDMFNRNHITDIIIKANKFDKEVNLILIWFIDSRFIYLFLIVLQMNYFGFRVDYKKFRKRIQYHIISAWIIALILILLTFYFHKSLRDARPFRDVIIFYASYILAFASRSIMTMKYSYILINLSVRYGQLNTLLRYVKCELWTYSFSNSNF